MCHWQLALFITLDPFADIVIDWTKLNCFPDHFDFAEKECIYLRRNYISFENKFAFNFKFCWWSRIWFQDHETFCQAPTLWKIAKKSRNLITLVVFLIIDSISDTFVFFLGWITVISLFSKIRSNRHGFISLFHWQKGYNNRSVNNFCWEYNWIKLYL